jgi:hypothetical protein
MSKVLRAEFFTLVGFSSVSAYDLPYVSAAVGVSLRWVSVGGRTSAYVGEMQKHPNGQVSSKPRRKKGSRVSYGCMLWMEESDHRSEDDSTSASDEKSAAAGVTKRKREVSFIRTSTSSHDSRAEVIVSQGSIFGIERKQEAEGMI